MNNRILVLILLPIITSCAYMHDRGRDACDMVTLSGEALSVNAAVQIGPAVIGIGGVEGKGFGLRSGAVGIYRTEEDNHILGGSRTLVPNQQGRERDKGYEYYYGWYPWGDKNSYRCRFEEGEWYNAWQVEATLGLGAGVRAGVNLAEIFDFILGWTGLDICEDDISKIRKDERERPSKTNTYSSVWEEIQDSP